MNFFEEQKKLNDIQELPVYKQILADSFGGVMYNVANREKYDTTELMEKWNALNPAIQEMAGGIMKGAIDFVDGAI